MGYIHTHVDSYNSTLCIYLSTYLILGWTAVADMDMEGMCTPMPLSQLHRRWEIGPKAPKDPTPIGPPPGPPKAPRRTPKDDWPEWEQTAETPTPIYKTDMEGGRQNRPDRLNRRD